jgi:endonuclease YncB( thermonuclease family)
MGFDIPALVCRTTRISPNRQLAECQFPERLAYVVAEPHPDTRRPTERPTIRAGALPSDHEEGHAVFAEGKARLQLLLAARRVKRALLTPAFALATLAVADGLRGPFSARVVGITDGDSIVVLAADNARVDIRLDGIDCPELGQDFGRRAKQFTSDLLFGRDVLVTPKSLDRYGRSVARVLVSGRDVSTEVVRAGYAWHFVRYSSDPVLAEAEQAARAARRGLWQRADAIAPWDFRAGNIPLQAGAAPYHGNTSSRVFHRAGCPNYRCRNCTQEFSTREAALAAGYRPAGCCRP